MEKYPCRHDTKRIPTRDMNRILSFALGHGSKREKMRTCGGGEREKQKKMIVAEEIEKTRSCRGNREDDELQRRRGVAGEEEKTPNLMWAVDPIF